MYTFDCPKLQQTRHSGFTLIEVLVAMAILAVALAAASRASSLALNHSLEIKQRILADMVAQNQLSRHLANDDWLSGKLHGFTQQAGITFEYVEEIRATPNPAFRKITVTVYAPQDNQHVLRQLVGYLVNPEYQYAQSP